MASVCAAELVITEGGGGNREWSPGKHPWRQLVWFTAHAWDKRDAAKLQKLIITEVANPLAHSWRFPLHAIIITQYNANICYWLWICCYCCILTFCPPGLCTSRGKDDVNMSFKQWCHFLNTHLKWQQPNEVAGGFACCQDHFCVTPWVEGMCLTLHW